ncbi:hypothetical protein GN956_G4651 [Arapaima gigas]
MLGGRGFGRAAAETTTTGTATATVTLGCVVRLRYLLCSGGEKDQADAVHTTEGNHQPDRNAGSYVLRKIRASIAEKEQLEESEGQIFTPCSRDKAKAKLLEASGSDSSAAMLTSVPDGAIATTPSTKIAVEKCGS